MKQKIIEIPIYGGRLILIRDINFEKANRKYGLDIEDHLNACACGGPSKSKNFKRDYFIVIKEEYISMPILAHEALHVTNFIFLDRGVTATLEVDEHQAILMEWIIKQAEEFYKS